MDNKRIKSISAIKNICKINKKKSSKKIDNKKNEKEKKIFKLDKEEREKLNDRYISITELFDLESKNTQRSKKYEEINNDSKNKCYECEKQNKNRIMKEYDDSGVIDFDKRNKIIKEKRDDNMFKRKKEQEKNISKKKVQKKEIQEKKKEENKIVENKNGKDKTEKKEQKTFREMIFEGQKTPQEFEYEKSWKEFAKAVRENQKRKSRNHYGDNYR